MKTVSMQRAALSREVYERAEQFLPWNVEKKVFGLFSRPHWIGAKDNFWFLRKTRDGKEFVLVLPDLERVEPAFDHKKLAEGIFEISGEKCDPKNLPFDVISYTNETKGLLFPYKDLVWECDLATYRCHAIDASQSDRSNTLRSPDGEWDLIVEEGNLVLQRTHRGERWQISSDAEESFTYATSPDTNLSTVTLSRQGILLPPIALWSPDGKKFVTHRLDQRKVPLLSLIQHVPPGDEIRPQLFRYHYPFVGDPLATQELLIFDLEKKAFLSLNTEPLPVNFLSLIEMAWVFWDRDGTKLYFLEESRGAKSISLYEANPETGEVRKVVEEASDEYVEPNPFFPFGCSVYPFETTEEILWLSERDGWAHLYLLDRNTGECKQQVTQGPWDVLSVEYVDEEKREVFFLACGRETHRDPYYPHLYRIDLKQGNIKLLTTAVGAHSVFFSPSRRYFVDHYSTIDATTLPRTELLDHNGKKKLDLAIADVQALFDEGWHPPERFSIKASDGVTPLYGLLYFPSRFDSRTSYPIIDFIQPGPNHIATAKAFSSEGLPGPWLPQALAELGCIVVTLDGRGTPFRSRQFHHATYGQLEGGMVLEDHIHGIKELAAERLFMDITRIGVIGHASGAYEAVRALLFHPDFFHVGVASGGDHNLLSYLAYWGEKYQGLYEEKRYRNQPNHLFAERLQGKLLLAHGELDDNVHPCGTIQLVDALIQANKDFEYLFLPNENDFCFQNPYFIRKYWDFFVRHLLQREPPENYAIKKIRESFPSFS